MHNRKPKDPENKLVQAGLLLDTYGALLTERQRHFMRLHYEEDLSFSQIAREFKISRQAVHDSVKHAMQTLGQMEGILQLVGKLENPSLPTAHLGGRQLIERLMELRMAVLERDTCDPKWVAGELDSLIALLQVGTPADKPLENPEPENEEALESEGTNEA